MAGGTGEQADSIHKGIAVLPKTDTVAGLLDHWLKDVAKYKLKETTWQGYKRTIERHIKPELGTVRVQKLTPADVQRFLSKKQDAKTGARTIQLCYLRLSQALDYATRTQLVPRNVCALIEPPTAPARRGWTWTAAEARTFLVKAETATYAPLWHVLLATGCRIGEALALRWQDVDVPNSTIHIERTLAVLQRGKGEKAGLIFQSPKSKAAMRTVTVPQELVDTLKAGRAAAKATVLRAGTGWHEDALVFPTKTGQPIHFSDVHRVFNRLCDDADVPVIRLHDLRHTAASLLIAQGEPIAAISEQLGHARPSITTDIYGHALASSRTHLAQTMSGLLFAKEAAS